MNLKNSLLTRIVAWGLLILSVCLGSTIGIKTLYRYDVFVRAILGITVLYLAIRTYVLSPSDKDEKEAFAKVYDFPYNLRIFGFAFILAIIFYWAWGQISDMIMYLIRR